MRAACSPGYASSASVEMPVDSSHSLALALLADLHVVEDFVSVHCWPVTVEINGDGSVDGFEAVVEGDRSRIHFWEHCVFHLISFFVH